MHSLTAKPFGFPAAIAHGMWTKARCLAALESRLPDAFAVDVRFRKPILLPARVDVRQPAGRRGDRLRGPRRQEGHAPPRRPRRPGRAKPKTERRRRSERPREQGMAERSMGLGLRALNRLAGSDLLDRIRMRKQVERALFQRHQDGFRAAAAAGRTFKAAQQLGKPARQTKGKSTAACSTSRPTTSSRCSRRRSARSPPSSCARPRSRPTPTRETPAEILDQAGELGVTMLGVPEELGGVMQRALGGRPACWSPRRSPTATWASPSPPSPPARVATALGLWGTAEQQATYLPAFTGEDVPAAALAILEPRPLFDPLAAGDDGAARRRRAWCSTAPSRSSPAPSECELFVVAADAEGTGRRCSSSSPAPRASRSRPSRRWACAPPPPAACCSRACGCRRARCSARATPGRGLRRVRQPRAASPGARSRSAPRRRCSTT